ncbi:MAG: deoxyuridine 5'-triphosphate nucleotidohydrolase [Candidatus Omnitrophica bacterium]|nr:deoxyuridine 5'-triphosphate nucleotidohydrolase [Candidatus Omnitrophota bacterium]
MLNREEIEKLIKENGLVSGYIHLETQLTPNGFDLTAAEVFEFDSAGSLDFSNKERAVPGGNKLEPNKRSPDDRFGWWDLKSGAYKIRTNEIVALPNDLAALAFSRTSLLRMGAFTQHGVWDAGFRGRGEFVMVVQNPRGIRVKQNARVAQLIFTRINETARGYDGIYKEK